MKINGTRFVMSPAGSALGLPAGEYWAVPDAELSRLQTDAQALWAYRVIEKATLVAGSYSPGYLPRHEVLLLEKAKELVAKDPSLDPEVVRT
jgi:hypothetical protein